MSQQNDARYQDIMRRIAARKAESGQKTTDPAQILDALNTLDTLTPVLKQRSIYVVMCGLRIQHRQQQSAVLLWYRQPGAMGYRTLYIFGVWAIQQDNAINIRVGVKILPYTAPVYVAEAYHKLIQQDYTIYYKDDGNAPDNPEALLYQRTYAPEKRLEIRRELEQCIQDWLATLKAPIGV